jgi:imidazolonepropionase-like amidohydrolase
MLEQMMARRLWSGLGRGLTLLAAVSVSGVLLAPLAAQPQPPAPQTIVVKAARLFDSVAGTIVANPVVVISGDRVTSVGPRLATPDGADVIDLGDVTLLPGLIDAHTHVTSQPGDNYYEDMFRRSPVDAAVVAHLYARRTLEAGFTTIRDVGAAEYVDVALRNAIDRGDIVGPRMAVATLAVSATGGHGDTTGFSPYLRFEGFSNIADGVADVQKLVRRNVKYGADLIKVLATAGVLSEEESVGAPQYSQEELNALVQEAAMWGRKVAAHAHGTEGIKRAIRAGVASVEHASFIDEEGIRLAKQRGTYLVMDIYNDDYILAEFARKGYPDKIIQKEKLVGRTQRENFRAAVKAGATMAFGTDAGVYPHGWNAKQFAKMVEWGMTPVQAIQAASVHAAALLGRSDTAGAVKAGAFADLIAVRGDVLRDVSTLESVAFVMKGGVVYKDTIRKGTLPSP